MRSMNGMTMLSPGCSTAWKRPRRSMTQAFCCGTTLTAFMTKVTATTRMTIAISDGTVGEWEWHGLS